MIEAGTKGKKGIKWMKLVYSQEYACPLINFWKSKITLTNKN